MVRPSLLVLVLVGLQPAATVIAEPTEEEVAAQLKKADHLRKAGDYPTAETLYRQVLAEMPRLYGKDSALEARVSNNLALLYKDTGRYEQAEPLYKRCLEIREARLGKDHPDTATILNNLAILYRITGRYELSEPLCLRALEIYEARLGKDHPKTAAALNNLATLYWETGRYEQAEPLYKRCLEIREARLGKDHPDTATALNNLAQLYQDTARYEQAEPLFKRSLEIREARLGKDHPATATALNNLAGSYQDMGRYEQAEPLYKRCLEIREARLGKDHPDTATALNNLADFLQRTGRYEQAEPIYKRCLEIYGAKLGKDHPKTAAALGNLAGLYQDMGRYEQAEPIYKRCLEIREARLGEDHPDTAAALDHLADLYCDMGRLSLAVPLLDRSRRSVQRHVTRVLPSLGEREQLDFLRRTDVASLGWALSLALARPDEDEWASRTANWLVNAKGLVEQSRGRALLAIRDSRHPGLADDLKALLALRRQVAQLSLQGPRPGQEAEHRQLLADLAAQEQTMAERLLRQGAAVTVPVWVELPQVQSALPTNAVFIDFARFDFRDPRGKRQPARYAAWVTPKSGPTRLFDLGDAKAIDDAIAAVRKALEEAPKVLKADGEVRAEKAAREPLTLLAKLILDPLRKDIDRAERWIIGPDAALWLIPWNALPLADKAVVIEKHSVQLVVSGRDLLARPPVPGKSTAPALFADPDFDGAAGVLPGETRSLSGELKLGRIPRLPGTALEADAVADKIARTFGAPPRVFTEGRATSAAFLALDRPRALTLATHGFFLPDQEPDPKEKERLQRDPNAKPATRIEDPLLRCGLLLAGCNRPGEAGRAGVLTGREVLSADLRGCELVVLSACETGLGDVRQGEGVAGLRQAFQLAGAECVVASLWKVPDDETTLHMVAFMDALSKGHDRVEALALAQRTRIAQRREKFGAAHPFNWAAFSLTGSAGR